MIRLNHQLAWTGLPLAYVFILALESLSSLLSPAKFCRRKIEKVYAFAGRIDFEYDNRVRISAASLRVMMQPGGKRHAIKSRN
jgi:hypothetical protein